MKNSLFNQELHFVHVKSITVIDILIIDRSLPFRKCPDREFDPNNLPYKHVCLCCTKLKLVSCNISISALIKKRKKERRKRKEKKGKEKTNLSNHCNDDDYNPLFLILFIQSSLIARFSSITPLVNSLTRLKFRPRDKKWKPTTTMFHQLDLSPVSTVCGFKVVN